jgi:hypothetical protein
MTDKKEKINIYKEPSTSDNYFYLNNGIPVKNLAELLDQLANMDKELFNYHVNKKNNDFANWVRGVFGEKELARRINMSRSPQGMLKAIIKFLETKS